MAVAEGPGQDLLADLVQHPLGRHACGRQGFGEHRLGDVVGEGPEHRPVR
jgi:hypothetical protein